MRISDVEIISMLTPASAIAAKNVAVTPGCERMPAPISDTFPIWSSKSSDSNPMRDWIFVSALSAVWASAVGSVNEMSVRPVAAAETFWTIMSMLISASASVLKMKAASPTLSGTPTTVILASLRSCATPEMIGCSISVPSV